jgi:hypothetical protein
MHPKTPTLKRQLQLTTSLADQVKMLGHAFAGETLYIITCGPSLNSLDLPALSRKLQGRLVLSVKQGFRRFEDVSDFHIYNSANHQRYAYKNPDSIRICLQHAKSPALWGPQPDVLLTVDPELVGKPEFSLARTHRFESYLLSKQLLRPFGPGLMYEICFYLAVHMGVKRCVVVAWDLAPDEKSYCRFYDQRSFLAEGRQRFIRFGGRFVKRIFGCRAESRWNYRWGLNYTQSQIFSGEMTSLIGSTYDVQHWLAGHGIELCVLSNRSCVDASIPRITLNDL